MMNEFDIIKNYFTKQSIHRTDVIIGIGDDAAIVKVPPQHELVVTTDSLLVDVHFPASTSPADIAHKALAVNLSDLAAMAATPAWFTLALTIPNADTIWLSAFADGLFKLAYRYQIELIGGDLTRGPLSITIQAMGYIPEQQAILRSLAKPGDLIYVTGQLGEAGLALKLLSQKKIGSENLSLLERLNRPEPRIEVGERLRGIAHAAIDISDGLAADLGHILEESHVGAVIYVDKLPFSTTLKHLVSVEEAIALALNSGDDYELCFTVSSQKKMEIEKRLSDITCSMTCIGYITQQSGLVCQYQNGIRYHGTIQGYQHF